MGYYKIVGTQVHTANTQIDSEFKSFTKEILEDGTEMYQPQELQDALDALKLEEDKATQIAEAKEYLTSTDFYFTVDKYATLSEDRKLELNKLRAEARANKDFATSDKIRDELAKLDIELKDGKDGTVFNL